MNFKLVERESIIIDEVYEDVKNDYLHSNIPLEEIRTNYGLSHCDWRDISRRIKEEAGINKRHSIKAKYYYYSPIRGDWSIQKKTNGVLHHLGYVPTKKIAKHIVELCKNCEWDLEKCYDYVQNWRNYYDKT